MNSAELSDLQGYLALEVRELELQGDPRSPQMIADEILDQVRAPDLQPTIDRLYAMVRHRLRPDGDPPARVLP